MFDSCATLAVPPVDGPPRGGGANGLSSAPGGLPIRTGTTSRVGHESTCGDSRRPAATRDDPGGSSQVRMGSRSGHFGRTGSPGATGRGRALSQHGLCGRRVEKTLADRIHRCPPCGLIADRDAVSAALAAHLVFALPGEPRAATVDYAKASVSLTRPATRRTLRHTVQGRPDAPTESTAPSDLGGFSTGDTRRTPSVGMAARRIVGTAPHPTPDEPGHLERTTPDRMRLRNDLSRDGGETLPALRDSSESNSPSTRSYRPLSRVFRTSSFTPMSERPIITSASRSSASTAPTQIPVFLASAFAKSTAFTSEVRSALS